MKYKIVFSYDGSKYFGYAIQENERNTIQEVVEKSISTILNSETKIYASGRTDKGVHALNQVATFDYDKKINLSKFRNGLNKMLPNDIFIKKASKVDDEFNARFSCKSKTYLYVINLGDYNPFLRNFEYTIKDLDMKLMRQCAKLFIGEHCFQNFTSKKEDQDNFVRIIYKISFKETKDNHILVEFKGNGFMKYMVRKLMGAIIEVGRGHISLEFVKKLLDSSKRDIITYTAPPHALFLKKVEY